MSVVVDSLELLSPAKWMRDALCAKYPAARHYFFPERGESTEQAKALCARCAVREECLDYALREHIQHGIWGGMSERERRRMRSQRRRRAA